MAKGSGKFSGPVGGEVATGRARGATVAAAGKRKGVYVPPAGRGSYVVTAKPVTLTLLGGGATSLVPAGSVLAITTVVTKAGTLRYTLAYTAPDGRIFTGTAR